LRGGGSARRRRGEPAGQPEGRRLAVLSLAALGVVYGDIGTSPLYALRECFHGEYAVPPTPPHVLGVLSLMFWSLMVVVNTKYLGLILRADNRGEGGVIALMALVTPPKGAKVWHRRALIALGLFGASLLYGDGMITPAISVLSAVEGLGVAAPVLAPFVVPLTAGILVGLFLFQRRGSGGVGVIFGPVTLVWFALLAALGLRGIVLEPQVLAAVNPVHAVTFFVETRGRGFLVLGAVFLVVTGAEALYADLGHFGTRPIRTAWFVVVLPALLLNYFGQGALVLRNPEAAHHPFYNLAPTWAVYPIVFLATAATIIASQAVISGAFSLTRQAIQLGYCPRLEIAHTAPEEIGQVYIPRINSVLMVATIALVFGFRSSSRLAAAYGVAVTTTMLIATSLFFVVARERWKWSLWKAGLPTALFLVADLSFFGANIGKITHGAWFPLVIGAAVYTTMSTWKRGREILGQRLREQSVSLKSFIEQLEREPPLRVPGRAVFLTGNPGIAPGALLHNLKHNKVLHEEVVVLTVSTEEVPHVPTEERVEVESLGSGFFRVQARYGFMEDPHVPYVLRLAKDRGLEFSLAETSFFLGREVLLASRRSGMPAWREKLFQLLSRNAQAATAFFHIPPDLVIELGSQIQL
jgi:KUP system potassium uptake protein